MIAASNGEGRKPRTAFRIGKLHADRDYYGDNIWNWRWDDRLLVSVALPRHITFALYGRGGGKAYIGIARVEKEIALFCNNRRYSLRELGALLRDLKRVKAGCP